MISQTILAAIVILGPIVAVGVSLISLVALVLFLLSWVAKKVRGFPAVKEEAAKGVSASSFSKVTDGVLCTLCLPCWLYAAHAASVMITHLYWDRRIDKMCSADTANKVYEQVPAIPEILRDGDIYVPPKPSGNSELPPIYTEQNKEVLHSGWGGLEVSRNTTSYIRAKDNKVLGQHVYYSRIGSYYISYAHQRGYSCPLFQKGEPSIESLIFITDPPPKLVAPPELPTVAINLEILEEINFDPKKVIIVGTWDEPVFDMKSFDRCKQLLKPPRASQSSYLLANQSSEAISFWSIKNPICRENTVWSIKVLRDKAVISLNKFTSSGELVYGVALPITNGRSTVPNATLRTYDGYVYLEFWDAVVGNSAGNHKVEMKSKAIARFKEPT